MKIVNDYKSVYKHISFICMAIYATAISVFNMLPPQLQNSFDQQELRWGSLALIGIGMVGKYVDQNLKGSDDD